MYLYIHDKYTQLIYYVNKHLFWMRLIAMNISITYFFLIFNYILNDLYYNLNYCIIIYVKIISLIN